jgi:hypothetical protein
MDKEPFVYCEYCQKSWKALKGHTRPNTTIPGNIRNLIAENKRLAEALEKICNAALYQDGPTEELRAAHTFAEEALQSRGKA